MSPPWCRCHCPVVLENSTTKKLGKTIVESLLSKKQESYFPIKNEKELECFKKSNILDNQELLRQYVFIEYKKILDRNNGELEKKYGKKIVLNLEIDENILGGGIIKVGSNVINGSLKHQIEDMKRMF